MKETNLHNICLIIDLDGFFVGTDKIFYTREIGYASLTKNYENSFRFDLTRLFNSLTDKDYKTISYCKFNVHGLSFRPMPCEKDTLPRKKLKDIILAIYQTHKTFDKNIIAYKGGHIERDLLDELEIPSINLEDYGCPKYEKLPTPQIKDCGFHVKMEHVHCPKVECAAFAIWVKEKMQQEED